MRKEGKPETQEAFQAACFRWHEERSVAPRWKEEEVVVSPLDLFCQAGTVCTKGPVMPAASCRLVQEVAAALLELDTEATGLPLPYEVSAGLCLSHNGDIGWKL